jgi:hypothetical protein
VRVDALPQRLVALHVRRLDAQVGEHIALP